jgi:hypothetical protein
MRRMSINIKSIIVINNILEACMVKSARTLPAMRDAFKVELARGASHISSTTTPESMSAAVAEVLDGFVADRGPDTFEEFRLLLAQDLKKRGCTEGARAVSACGRVGFS